MNIYIHLKQATVFKALMLLTATFFKVEDDGHKVVLAREGITSDNIRRGGIPYDAERLETHINVKNTELLTVAANQKENLSAYGLLKKGLVPDGALVELSVSCFMNLSK